MFLFTFSRKRIKDNLSYDIYRHILWISYWLKFHFTFSVQNFHLSLLIWKKLHFLGQLLKSFTTHYQLGAARVSWTQFWRIRKKQNNKTAIIIEREFMLTTLKMTLFKLYISKSELLTKTVTNFLLYFGG